MVDLKGWLLKQQEKGQLRSLTPLTKKPEGHISLTKEKTELIDFSSNDYLGLSSHPTLVAAAAEALNRYGTGSGAARLMSGNLGIHQELEAAIARLKGKEAGLTFGSGYMANTGIIPALVGRHDLIYSDRLNHASIHDGCKLSMARTIRFQHNNLAHLESLLKEKRADQTALIIVESIYSMDGDRCPLAELVELKKKYNCLLMVDEAHATGVFGANGGGIIEEEGVGDGVDLAMGTFGKALGSYGAYVAASREMIDYLLNRARSFIFSTALPPAVAAASLAAVELIQQEPDLRRELQKKINFFKESLKKYGISTDLGPSQIIPLLIGNSKKTVAIAQSLRNQGIFATAVRPPTVPEGTARLRFTVNRLHRKEDLALAAKLIAETLAAQ
jgi:8-amino-7-oxononanoate synthase